MIQRGNDAFIEAGAFLQHRLRGVEAGLFEAGQRGDLVEAGEFGHAEKHVLEWGLIAQQSLL